MTFKEKLFEEKMLIGGIDIGTNTVRLMVGNMGSHGLEELEILRKITRLGESVAATGMLTPSGISRTVEALVEFSQVIHHYSVKKVCAVGTSAVRSAKNRQYFLNKVFQETGFEVEVISGEEEARRTFEGTLLGTENKKENCMVLDIGGGSTEFILGNGKKIDAIFSIPLGVVSLTEQILKSDPIQSSEIELLRLEINHALENLSLFQKKNKLTLIGTAGTLTTLGAMMMGLSTFDRKKVHNFIMDKVSIEKILGTLLGKTLLERRKLIGLEAGREDVMVPGILILLTVMEKLKISTVKVSDFGLLEGIIFNYAKKIGMV